MKIFICASKHNYHRIEPIKQELEKMGHEITLPNSFDKPFLEEEMKNVGRDEHKKWKAEKLREQEDKVRQNDVLLILNFEKNGQKNYIGGATFLEMFKAWEMEKKIFLYNDLPENILTDEIKAFDPEIIFGDLSLIK